MSYLKMSEQISSLIVFAKIKCVLDQEKQTRYVEIIDAKNQIQETKKMKYAKYTFVLMIIRRRKEMFTCLLRRGNLSLRKAPNITILNKTFHSLLTL
jgi:hypothetical protein